ncbi:cytochrome P450 [Panaeolus papilionaceus]|nr:cytochrome P450 [Panaeolus papilionaceus]
MSLISKEASTTLLIGLVGVAVLRAIVSRVRRPKYPPGPTRLPLVGNLLQLPKEEAWVTYKDWKEKYGDVIYLEVMGSPMVILNTYQACVDILEKRSDIYSDRPMGIMASQLMGWKNAVTLSPYGDKWRKFRRMCAQTMRKEAVKVFFPIQEREVSRFLGTILEEPTKFMENFRFTAGRSLLISVYGIHVDGAKDPIIQVAEKAMSYAVYATQPGNFLVDFFPALLHVPSWMPGTGWRKYAAEGKALADEMVEAPFNTSVNNIKNGSTEINLTGMCLERNEDPEIVKWCSGTMFSAGVDTSVASIHAFVLAMLLHPNIQNRVQAEIDLVVGTDRLPLLTDRDDLPFTNAVMKELMRWQPVSPFALPHRLIKDDIYNECFIPEGTTVMPNTWAVTRDPTLFPNPDKFIPDRYLPMFDKTIPCKPEDLPMDPEKFAFGYGRRICAGMHYADTMLFITIASLMHSFDIVPALDANGKEIIPEAKFNSSIVREALDFQVTIKPRSEAHRQLILANA